MKQFLAVTLAILLAFSGAAAQTIGPNPVPNVSNSTGTLPVANGGFPYGNNSKIAIRNSRIVMPSRLTTRQVCASPPTVSWGTTNTITAKQWPPFAQTPGTASQTAPGGSYYTFTRAGSFLQGNTSNPNFLFMGGQNIHLNGSTSYTSMQASFIYTGSAFSLVMAGYNEQVLLKVDDCYTTLTPQSLPNSGVPQYAAVTFSGAGRHRIDVLINSNGGNFNQFGGIYTAATDTVQPAQVRGPRVIFVGDSKTAGVNATAGAASNYVQIFSELMGWDDVWASGIGGTGYLQGTPTYGARLATDVCPYNPDIVVFTGSTNDASFTASQIAAAELADLQTVQACAPNAMPVVVSPFLVSGPGYAGNYLIQASALLKVNVLSVGGFYINLQQMPTTPTFTPLTLTLSASASAAATAISTTTAANVGADYQFPDGTQFHVLSYSAGTTQIDKLANSESNGAVAMMVGSSLWQGNGHVGATTGVGNCDVLIGSDGIHDTQAGYEAIAEAIAYGFMNQLSSN